MFTPHLARWNLFPDGEAIHTHSSDLLPVLFEGQPAILKVARSDEEQTGNRLMFWLNGQGAARVYAQHDGAALLERLNDQPALADMARHGQDDEATRILCHAIARLHQHNAPPPELPTLQYWFRSLRRAAPLNARLGTAWAVAQDLLNAPQDITVLHGDLHHGNVLHSTERGWLLIDPKGLIGERGFDYANLFYNPDTDHAAIPGRLTRQAHLTAQLAGLEYTRLLKWIAAYGGVSAAWWLEDSNFTEAEKVLKIVEMALAELSVSG